MTRTVPLLPCRELDDVVPFYEALGFQVTYRQARPNPIVSFRREDVDLMFFGVAGFEPADSMGSCLLIVPDTRALFEEFAAGLRAHYGRLPISGIPPFSSGSQSGQRPASHSACTRSWSG